MQIYNVCLVNLPDGAVIAASATAAAAGVDAVSAIACSNASEATIW